ncbi:MAG: hypothetical protein R3321_02260, partial [Nitrososphaeraceae archaeon]|nr:hypothetical protein [Nitrososphaeraceae archaeon]
IRLTPAVVAAIGAPPTAAVNRTITAKVSRSVREYGLRPRTIVLARVIGSGDDTFKKYAYLPILTPTSFVAAAYAVNASLEYDGLTWTIVGKQGEDSN